MVIKPGKHQRSRHTCQDLCRWKVHYSAQSFVLRAYAIHELRNQHVSLRSWRYCKFKRRSRQASGEAARRIGRGTLKYRLSHGFAARFWGLRRQSCISHAPYRQLRSLTTRYLFISRGHSRFSFTSRATDQAKEGPLVICHSY